MQISDQAIEFIPAADLKLLLMSSTVILILFLSQTPMKNYDEQVLLAKQYQVAKNAIMKRA
jgi:hypothetical protein